jgi:hypothetical protein
MRGSVRVILILAAVWVVAGILIWWTRAARPTPEALTAYVAKHPLDTASASGRSAIIDKVASQLNRLNFEERQKVRKSGVDRDFFAKLTPEERQRFLDLTLPEGFRQLMLALNKMKPEERKKIVQRALDNLEKDDPQMDSRVNQQDVQKMIGQGVESFYRDASADTKLDFAPVLEQLQRVIHSR